MLKQIVSALLILATACSLRAEIFMMADYNLSVRSAGLRNCDAAITPHASAVFANPALIGDLGVVCGGVSINRGFGEQQLTSLYGVYPLGEFTAGAGFAYLGYGEFASYADQSLKEKNTFEAGDLLMTAVISQQVLPNLTAGGAVKFLHSDIGGYSSSAIGFDMTGAYRFLEGTLTLAGGVYNAGWQLDAFNQTREELPLSLKAGLSNRFRKIPLEVALQYNYRAFGRSDYGAALEFRPRQNLHIRAGYDFTGSEKAIMTASQKEKFAGLGLGGTIFFKYFSVDIAYQINGELEETIGFSLNSSLQAFAADNSAKP